MRSCRLSWIALVLSALPAAAQNQHDMTFHTVPPCTVVDTRVVGGAFAVGETRTYNVVGTGSLAAQGGSATGCSVPGFSNGIAQVQAVALNVVAVTPTGVGYIVANAADQPLAGSVVNFAANQNAANTTPVAVAQASGVGDFKIQVSTNSAHVVIRAVGYYSKPVQTVYVHPVPGDNTASGTALLSAMSGITNASATKRYVIKLEPGTYDLGSTMLTQKAYVDLEGSGQQATVIQGVGNSDGTLETAVVKGGSSAEIRDLQVKTAGTSSLPSIAILVIDGADTRITNVTAVASGGVSNWAIRNRNATAVIEDATLKAEGGAVAYGVSSKGTGSAATVKRSVIEVSNATSQTYGLSANAGGTYKEIRDVQAKVSAAGGSAYGFKQDDEFFPSASKVRITNSTIDVTGTSTNRGVEFNSLELHIELSQIRANGTNSIGVLATSGTTVVEHSEIAGASDTVDNTSFIDALIGASRLEGGAASGAICAGVYDESFTFFAGPACP